MKIAIYHNLPSGGAKRALSETVKRLGEKHDFHVFTLSTADHDFGDLRPYCRSYRIFEYKRLPLFKSPFGRLNQLVRRVDLTRIQQVVKRVADEIETGDYDLVYVHPCQIENSPSLLRYIDGSPTLYFCQEPLRILYEQMPERPYDRRDSKLRILLNRFDPLRAIYFRALKLNDFRNLRSAGCVLVNSEFMKAAVSAIYGVQPRVNYLGVDSEFFRPNGNRRSDYLLSVGSLTPLKGFDFIIRALAEIPVAARPPLKIISNFANPEEEDYLRTLGRELNLDLELRKGVSEKELRNAYTQAALTVYAPVREPFGLVTIESMACGTPVVAVEEGGIRETVIDNQVGRLVNRDELSFATAVQSLLADPERREELGRNGRMHVEEKWSWHRAVERLDEAFREVTSG